MNLALWIVAGLLAVAFAVGGVSKLAIPKDKIATMPGAAWVEDFSTGAIKTLGALDLLAAAGLILPAALDIAPVFVPLAAVGVVLLMVGAVIVRLRHGSPKAIVGSRLPRPGRLRRMGPLRSRVLHRLTARAHPWPSGCPGRSAAGMWPARPF